ncbi:OLC1v1013910C1 [Oldenlandia corymbosa var. corymbosa]|uniref:OLC1v1013910C1 n=1 Tax=Oldenlandia corymbosa var. corymbosa TaxID=529605 RepID=A0AAV1E0B0_OLDCO|nr:OLC1v1013910C1 [Oldenlandia corymbosa var. corymbosa]
MVILVTRDEHIYSKPATKLQSTISDQVNSRKLCFGGKVHEIVKDPLEDRTRPMTRLRRKRMREALKNFIIEALSKEESKFHRFQTASPDASMLFFPTECLHA